MNARPARTPAGSRLSRQGAHIITYHTSDVHASGHGNRGEAEWIHKQIRPKFFIPVHGYHYMLRVHADVAVELGMDAKHIVIPDNSSLIDITDGEKIAKLPIKAPSELRVVEGQTVSENLRRPHARPQSARTGRLLRCRRHRRPSYRQTSQITRHHLSRICVSAGQQGPHGPNASHHSKSVETSMRNPRATDLDVARDDLAESVSRFLLQKTMKRPIVIPVIVSV